VNPRDPAARLCYGTNVHPAEDLESLEAVLDGPAAAVRARFAPGGTLGLGLWLPARVAAELAGSEKAAAEVRARLRDRGLRVETVNAFPAGGFHAAVVKEAVYHPDWSDPVRLAYTRDVARAVTRLVEPGTTCVVSTLPGTWKAWRDGPAERGVLARGAAAAAATMADLEAETSVRVVLAPEPEPGCTLETIEEAADFWNRDLPAALGRDADRLLPHLGLTADLCHLAVTEGDPTDALARLRQAGVPVVKVQVSAALAVDDPAENPATVEALRAFDEPRWLHQVGARGTSGARRRALDLPEVFGDLPSWLPCREWRVHFHAPLHRDEVAGVPTTRDATAAALRSLAARPGPLPALEVETYTWSAVPGFSGSDGDLAAAIAAELEFARESLEG